PRRRSRPPPRDPTRARASLRWPDSCRSPPPCSCGSSLLLLAAVGRPWLGDTRPACLVRRRHGAIARLPVVNRLAQQHPNPLYQSVRGGWRRRLRRAPPSTCVAVTVRPHDPLARERPGHAAMRVAGASWSGSPPPPASVRERKACSSASSCLVSPISDRASRARPSASVRLCTSRRENTVLSMIIHALTIAV